MNTGNKQKKPNPSEDLTVVLIRGNGIPRSFRLPLSSLYRSLTALGFLFALTITASVGLLAFSLLRAPAATEGTKATEAPPAEEGTQKPSIWSAIRGGSAQAPTTDVELEQEVAGLRADLARLTSQMEGRADLPANATTPLVQFMGPHSTLIPESSSVMRIRNATAVRDPASKRIRLDFELHNVDPRQRQEKGYIAVLAKSADTIASYPSGLFAPNQNILVDFNRGETFAISRFRQGQATFPLAPFEGKKVSYQILLFATDGKVLANAHVEDSR